MLLSLCLPDKTIEQLQIQVEQLKDKLTDVERRASIQEQERMRQAAAQLRLSSSFKDKSDVEQDKKWSSLQAELANVREQYLASQEQIIKLNNDYKVSTA